jgi:hypothetical protein
LELIPVPSFVHGKENNLFESHGVEFESRLETLQARTVVVLHEVGRLRKPQLTIRPMLIYKEGAEESDYHPGDCPMEGAWFDMLLRLFSQKG